MTNTSESTYCTRVGSFKSPKSPYSTYTAGSSLNGSNWIVTAPETRSSMTDVTGNRSGHNSVTHDVKSVQIPPTLKGPVYKYTNTVSPFGEATCECASVLGYYLVSDQSYLNHEAVPDGTLVARARVPVLNKQSVDGLVELYELKDLAGSLASVASILMDASARRVSTGKSYGSTVMRQIRDEFVSSPSQFLNTLVNGHLGYKFAVAPLAKACNDVMSALGQIDNAMRKMAKPFTVHGTYRYTKRNNYDTGWQVGASTHAYYSARRLYRKTTEVTWTQSALRQIDPNKLPSLDRVRLQAVLDSLGLNPSLRAVYEMIPRSFILDWFFPIRDFLEQFDDIKPSSSWFTTLSTYGSVKSVTTGSVTEEFAPLTAAHCSVAVSGLTSIRADFRRSTYTRTALVTGSTWAPATPFVPEPRLPQWQNWITVAEMLYQGSYKALRVKNRSFGV